MMRPNPEDQAAIAASRLVVTGDDLARAAARIVARDLLAECERMAALGLSPERRERILVNALRAMADEEAGR